MTTKDKSTELKIEFANKEAAAHFMSWLCESGEQQYWNWMECREDDQLPEDDGIDITAIDFDYDLKKHTIKTTLGRLLGDKV